MLEADRAYADSLTAIRRAAELTHVDLARQMGVAQSVVSRIDDSTTCCSPRWTRYLSTAGEHPRIAITING